jgi:hypothetical protein
MFIGSPYLVANELAARGYRRVSNRHRLVSRIDRPDWVERLARVLQRAPADFYVPGEAIPAGNWCDHYRRCLSTDVIEVDVDTFRLIPGSGYDQVGYIPAKGEEMPEEDGTANARLLIDSVTSALARGVEHYDKRGKRLWTTRDVLEALARDGSIELCEKGGGAGDQNES